jgi:hypothetical protein
MRYYVDFHALSARCTGAGFDAGHKFRFDTAGLIISRGLQPGYPEWLGKMDCHIMAAAQYILHAGDAMDAECVKEQLPPHRRARLQAL